MAIDVGNAAGWLNGHASPSTPVTDLSPHVDGGPVNAQRNSNANATGDGKAALHMGAAIVVGALVALWLMGVIVFKSANL